MNIFKRLKNLFTVEGEAYKPSRVIHQTLFNSFTIAAAAVIAVNIVFIIFLLWSCLSGISLDQLFKGHFDLVLLIVLLLDVVSLAAFVLERIILLFRIWRDITLPIKKLERHLSEIFNECYDREVVYGKDNEIGDMYKKVNGIRIHLKELSEERNRVSESRKILIGGLLHDIATPVTRISGCASMIKDGMISEPDSVKEYAGTILSSTEYISDLLAKLRPAVNADIETSQLSLIPVQIIPLLANYLEKLEPDLRLEDTHCVLVDDCVVPPVCEVDLRAAKRVINNLVYNSVKYKKPDEPCLITVTCSVISSEEVLISFSDNGVGIEPGTEKKLFEMFYREDSSRTSLVGGNGVGLYVCRETIKSFGGRIWAESNGCGLTINIVLPLSSKKPLDTYS